MHEPQFHAQEVLWLRMLGPCGCYGLLWRVHRWYQPSPLDAWGADDDVIQCGNCGATWLRDEEAFYG